PTCLRNHALIADRSERQSACGLSQCLRLVHVRKEKVAAMAEGSVIVSEDDSLGAAVVVRLAYPHQIVESDGMLQRGLGPELAAAACAAEGLSAIASPLSERRLSELFLRLGQTSSQRRQLTVLVRQRWVLISFEGGRPQADRVKLYLQDVTPLKLYERADNQAEHRLVTALETACVGVWEWNPGAPSITLCMRAATWLGIGNRTCELPFDTCLKRIHAADRPRVRAAAAACATPRAVSELHELEFRIKAADEQYHWVVLAAASLPRTEQSEFARITGSIRDTTLHRQLKQSDARQQELMSLAAEVQQAFLVDQSLVAACDRLFDPLLEITDSRLGFIGILCTGDDGAQYLEVPSISNISWDEASRDWYNSHRDEGQSLRFHSLNNLFGHVVTHNTIVCTETVNMHPASRGQPQGHPPIHNFLGIPLRFDGQAVRYEQHIALAVMDVDFFKSVNDKYGHQAGDKVLRVFADTLSDAVRRSDVHARVGGEEFAVLLAQTNETDAVDVLERFRRTLENTLIALNDGMEISITVSIGYCDFFDGLHDVDHWFNLADRALYQAKAQGRNRIIKWVPDPIAR
ncbi:sensor domain-containing diguanylate cyclase, partial [Stutzerimonas kunmingensis]